MLSRIVEHDPKHLLGTEDADLQKRLCIALTTHKLVADCEIAVAVRHGVVILWGKVSTHTVRHLIVEMTRHIAGVRQVEDRIAAPGESIESPPIMAAASDRAAKSRSLLSAVRQGSAHGFQRQRCAATAILALLLISFAGCSRKDTGRAPVHPVTGTIQYRGQPIPGALVTLDRKSGAASEVPTPRATVAKDGAFAVSTYDTLDGAPEGEYVLTVRWYKPVRVGADTVGGPNVLPRRYASPRTSDIRVTVAAGENHLPTIQLR